MPLLHVPDAATLISFTIAAFVVVYAPGITVSAVVSMALARGVVAGLLHELGATVARITMVIVAAVALEAVTGLVTAIFDIIKYAGAAYLIWLGIGYLRSDSMVKIWTAGASQNGWRQVVAGFFVLWGNPKALLFFGAFLPQFVNPDYPAWPQVVLLGSIEIVAAIIADVTYITIAATARSALTGPAAHWASKTAGVILIGAAVWLALQHH
ncbi:MAG TPA: LysE family translocator [Devosia sp.]|nr:LysE family translocator [Devosia sp.]